MKKFCFCALCLILAALLSACGRQAAQDVPGSTAVPSPAAVPEAPAENTSTPFPTAPAEIGKEFDDLSFLNEEQRHCRRVRLHARTEPLPELGYVLRRAAGYFHEGFS